MSKIIEETLAFLRSQEEGVDLNYLSDKWNVSESQICEVEKILDMNFPVSYRYFLKNFGSGGLVVLSSLV